VEDYFSFPRPLLHPSTSILCINIFCTRQWKGLDRKSTDDGHEDGKEALGERKGRTRSRVGGAIEVGGRLNGGGSIAHALETNRACDRVVAGTWNAVSANRCSVKKVRARVPLWSARDVRMNHRCAIDPRVVALVRWEDDAGENDSVPVDASFDGIKSSLSQ